MASATSKALQRLTKVRAGFSPHLLTRLSTSASHCTSQEKAKKWPKIVNGHCEQPDEADPYTWNLWVYGPVSAAPSTPPPRGFGVVGSFPRSLPRPPSVGGTSRPPPG